VVQGLNLKYRGMFQILKEERIELKLTMWSMNSMIYYESLFQVKTILAINTFVVELVNAWILEALL